MAKKEIKPTLNVEGIPETTLPVVENDIERLLEYHRLKAADKSISSMYTVPVVEVAKFDDSDNAVLNTQLREELEAAVDRTSPHASIAIASVVIGAVASTVASKIVDKKLALAVAPGGDDIIIRDPVTGAVLKDDFTTE